MWLSNRGDKHHFSITGCWFRLRRLVDHSNPDVAIASNSRLGRIDPRLLANEPLSYLVRSCCYNIVADRASWRDVAINLSENNLQRSCSWSAVHHAPYVVSYLETCTLEDMRGSVRCDRNPKVSTETPLFRCFGVQRGRNMIVWSRRCQKLNIHNSTLSEKQSRTKNIILSWRKLILKKYVENIFQN